MNEAEEYLKEKTEYDKTDYDVIHFTDMAKLMQSFADEQLKKKMPSDLDCLNKYGELHNDSQQYVGWSDAIKWIKQQILKP